MIARTRPAASVVLAGTVALVLGAAPLGAQGVPGLPAQAYTLPNGLQVLLLEDHSTPIVAVNTWYHVGSGDEKPGRTGFAHLFEHIMFMGSEHVPTGVFDQLLEAAGANNNGSTTQDRTNYYEVLPSNALPLALWLDSDRMGFLLPTMDQEKLDLQREVVKNERRQSYDNVPYGRAYETLLAALYPADHPYHWPTIGSMADLDAASLEDVRQFFRTYYAPNNATLAIVGDFEADSARALVETYFGGIPRGPTEPERPTVPAVSLGKDTVLVLQDRVQLPRYYAAWHSVKAFAPDDAALQVLSYVLAGDKNSRLYKRLVYELQAAQDVDTEQDGGRLDGMFVLRITPKQGQSPQRLATMAADEIGRVAREGIEPRELERARNTIRARSLDELASALGKSDQLNYYNYFVGTPDYSKQDAARFDAVTAADVQRVAKQYLLAPKVVLTVVPQGKPELAVKEVAR